MDTANANPVYAELDEWKLKAGMAINQAANYLAAIMAITPWLSASLNELPSPCKEYTDACNALFAIEQEALAAVKNQSGR